MPGTVEPTPTSLMADSLLVTKSLVTHINHGQKYRIVIERAAVKGVDGFKVEANGDDMLEVEGDVTRLYESAQAITKTGGQIG